MIKKFFVNVIDCNQIVIPIKLTINFALHQHHSGPPIAIIINHKTKLTIWTSHTLINSNCSCLTINPQLVTLNHNNQNNQLITI